MLISSERIVALVESDSPKIVAIEATGMSESEFISVREDGSVLITNSDASRPRLLYTLAFPLTYEEERLLHLSEGGQVKRPLQIFFWNDYCCIVQRYGANGVVLHRSDPEFRKTLTRGTYHVEHCSFPIAFFEKDGKAHLVHGTDWNRLDITELSTDRLLTERNVEKKTNYYDYFHSSLAVSPGFSRFTSNGWFWGPYDQITVYAVSDFLAAYEMSHLEIGFEPVDGYNWDRPMCWIDETTIAVAYNKIEEGEEEAGDFCSEIIFVDVVSNRMLDRINFDGFGKSAYGAPEGELFYDNEKDVFIGLSDRAGVYISDRKGNMLFQDRTLRNYRYCARQRFLYCLGSESRTVDCLDLSFRSLT